METIVLLGVVVLGLAEIAAGILIGWAWLTGRLVSRREHNRIRAEKDQTDATNREAIRVLEMLITGIAKIEKKLNTLVVRPEQNPNAPQPVQQVKNGEQG